MSGETTKSTRLTSCLGLRFTQAEVDFVIPDLAIDLPLCIDPFLLYKSKDAALRDLHHRLLAIFDQGVRLFRDGRRGELDQLIDFPEANEIGFGYSKGRIQGSGLGDQMNRLLADVLASSEALQERGLRHIEELQLISIGVGPDRISDIAANVLKSFLIEYTQRQATLWKIPLTAGMPVQHYFNFNDWSWSDGYFDLPRNPLTGEPILLVPRRIIRVLPWINYDDYVDTDYKMFLRPNRSGRTPHYPGMPQQKRRTLAKQEVVKVTRQQLTILEHYVARKERESSKAEPVLNTDHASTEAEYRRGDDFVAQLNQLPTGQAAAADYQRLVFEILNYLFEPHLTDGEMEAETYLGTERRDIIYANEAETSFWGYVRTTYGSPHVMFEIKNVKALELEHMNQAANYLGARLGMLGFIVTRHPPGDNIVRKAYAIFNDTPSMPRKTILILSDNDLATMIRLKQEGKSPTKFAQKRYQDFRRRVQ